MKGIRGGAEILALCAGNPLYYILPLWAYTNALSVPFTAATGTLLFVCCMKREERAEVYLQLYLQEVLQLDIIYDRPL